MIAMTTRWRASDATMTPRKVHRRLKRAPIVSYERHAGRSVQDKIWPLRKEARGKLRRDVIQLYQGAKKNG